MLIGSSFISVLSGVYSEMAMKTMIMALGLCVYTILSTMDLALKESECYFFMGNISGDFLSVSLTLLSVLITIFALVMTGFCERMGLFSVMVSVLLFCLLVSFSISSFVAFFVLFEVSLLPLFVIILGWGYQFERIEAINYMILYTVFGSLFFLFGVCSLVYSGVSDNMFSLMNNINKSQTEFWWLFVLGFLIKLPVYPFHLWLPKAHVEAPLLGSMLLAGVVLKLGGYGIIRLMWVLSVSLSSKLLTLLLSTAMLGGLYASIVCCRQVDMKCLVAYSSVGHMSLVLLGCMSNVKVGVMGSILIMIGHGLCSSGMFALVYVFYCMSGSRNIYLNKGALMVSPVLVMISFLLCSSNMAAPPSLNLFGEVLLCVCSYFISFFYLFLMLMMTIISAVYSLHLYTNSCYGGVSTSFNANLLSVNSKWVWVLLFHWLPLNFLFLFIP